MPARMSRAVAGSERSRGLIEQQRPRAVEHGLGQAHSGLLARRQHAAFRVAESCEIELFEQAFDPLRQVSDAVQQSEYAQVLINGQIPGKRRVNGRKIGSLESARPVGGDIDAIDRDRA